jgi:hypothetical protein
MRFARLVTHYWRTSGGAMEAHLIDFLDRFGSEG